MTDLLERPVEPARTEAFCSPHSHTTRCWWHAELAGWVCPPSGNGRT